MKNKETCRTRKLKIQRERRINLTKKTEESTKMKINSRIIQEENAKKKKKRKKKKKTQETVEK